jgi:pyridoxal phosphate enzyme (YggS family)
VKDRIDQIHHRIKNAALACGRDPTTVKLVAVSKTVPADIIRRAADEGVRIFGESYVQEALSKMKEIEDPNISWHFIGHLQSNKAKYVVYGFDLIHSVDTLKLAAEINRQAVKIGKAQDILVQVNISGEATKSGIETRNARALIEDISRLSYLRIKGLMTLPPFFDQPEKVRPYFRALSRLKDEIQAAGIDNVEMTELSMGMSGDFEAAITEGATMVRIGTALFGERL